MLIPYSHLPIQHLHHTLRQISRFLHLCAHSRTHKVYVLLNPQVRSRRLGIKSCLSQILMLIQIMLLTCQSTRRYQKLRYFIFHSSVIHASYLQTFQSKNSPQIILHRDGTVQGFTPSGLPLQILIDTGCHKTLLNKHFYERHYKKDFQNFRKIPFHEKHSITVENGQKITARICLLHGI